jgi:hypothetical protein
MPSSSQPRPPAPAGARGLLVYAVGWAVTGAVVALAVVSVLGGGDDDEVALPPVRETELTRAATRAGCRLRDGGARAGERPVVDGVAAAPSRAGFYDRRPPEPGLVGALRRGLVVISYRPSLDEDGREQLRALQQAAPSGTLVVPEERMRFAVAVSAYRRLLGCPRLEPRALEAVQLFRGRYVGSGPDSPP